MQVIAGPNEAAEGERLFGSHAAFMAETHHREGELAMLSYDVAQGPDIEDPLAPDLTPSGNTIFRMVEVYETDAGVAEHWRLGTQKWADFPLLNRRGKMEACRAASGPVTSSEDSKTQVRKG